jgi:hypothetical protein
LLGIENAEEVSVTVEGRRLIIARLYENPVEDLRARLAESQDDEATDAALNAATRQARAETVRKRRRAVAAAAPKVVLDTQIAEWPVVNTWLRETL